MHRRVMFWADAAAGQATTAGYRVAERFPTVKAGMDAMDASERAKMVGEIHAAIRDMLQEQVIESSEEFARALQKATDADALCFAMLLLGKEPPTQAQWDMLRAKADVLSQR